MKPTTRENYGNANSNNIRRTNYSFDSQVAVTSTSGAISITPRGGAQQQTRIKLPSLQERVSATAEKVMPSQMHNEEPESPNIFNI